MPDDPRSYGRVAQIASPGLVPGELRFFTRTDRYPNNGASAGLVPAERKTFATGGEREHLGPQKVVTILAPPAQEREKKLQRRPPAGIPVPFRPSNAGWKPALHLPGGLIFSHVPRPVEAASVRSIRL